MLIIWVFGSSGIALYILVHNRNRLEEEDIKRFFLSLYQGLKHKAFYWEFVNTIRKVLILIFNVLLAEEVGIYRAITAILVLIIIFRIQIRIKPYKDERNNEIEILAILTGTLTLFCGIIFVSEETSNSTINTLILLVVFIYNVYFILNWILLLLLTFKTKNKYLLMAKTLLNTVLRKNYKLEEDEAEVDKEKHKKEKLHKSIKLLPEEDQDQEVRAKVLKLCKNKHKKFKGGIVKKFRKKFKEVKKLQKEARIEEEKEFNWIVETDEEQKIPNKKNADLKNEIKSILKNEISIFDGQPYRKTRKNQATQMTNINPLIEENSSQLSLIVPQKMDRTTEELRRDNTNKDEESSRRDDYTDERIFKEENNSQSFKEAFKFKRKAKKEKRRNK